MTICDLCKNMEAKTLVVAGKIEAIPKYDTSNFDFRLDMCRVCFDKLRAELQPSKDNLCAPPLKQTSSSSTS